METEGDSATELALGALRAWRAGDLAAGVRLYRLAIDAPGGHALPVRKHVGLLEGTGLDAAAELLWRIGLQCGADLSSGLLQRGGDPREAITEYDDLFARGVANARMMSDYLVALSRAGASDRLEAAVDAPTLFRKISLDVDTPLLRAAASAILGATRREFQTATKSLRNLERVPGAHRLEDHALVALHTITRREVTRYIDDIVQSDHVIASWLCRDFSLASWGVISRDVGYSAPHIHTGCWVTGVVYVAGDDPGSDPNGAGMLRIGPAAGGDANCRGWPDLSVAPIPGTLVIMPAFYTHWTVPLRRHGLRIAIAFNADDGDGR